MLRTMCRIAAIGAACMAIVVHTSITAAPVPKGAFEPSACVVCDCKIWQGYSHNKGTPTIFTTNNILYVRMNGGEAIACFNADANVWPRSCIGGTFGADYIADGLFMKRYFVCTLLCTNGDFPNATTTDVKYEAHDFSDPENQPLVAIQPSTCYE